MDKISRLRRELIFRLIVFEYDLYGHLDLVEPFILGTADAVAARLAKGTLVPEDLSAIAKASLHFSKYARGELGIDGMLVNALYRKLPSAAYKREFNIGGMAVDLFPQYGKVVAIDGAIYPSLSICGYAEEGPSGNSREGRILVYSNQWDAKSTIAYPSLNLQGIMKKKSMQAEQAKATIGNSLPLYHLGAVTFSESTFGYAFVSHILKHLYGKTKEDILLRGNAIYCTKIRTGTGQTLEDLLLLGNLATVDSISAESSCLDSILMKGYINLQITKNIYGTLFSFASLSGRLRVYTEGQGLQSHKGMFIEGSEKILGFAPVLGCCPLQGVLNNSIVMGQAYSRLGKVAAYKRQFYTGQEYFNTLPRIRTEENLMPLKKEFLHSSMIADSRPSYQWREGIYGRLTFSCGQSIDALSELHTTMDYEIIPDEEFGGDTYEITTKYHKENEGLVEIGWRYFGYLIE